MHGSDLQCFNVFVYTCIIYIYNNYILRILMTSDIYNVLQLTSMHFLFLPNSAKGMVLEDMQTATVDAFTRTDRI